MTTGTTGDVIYLLCMDTERSPLATHSFTEVGVLHGLLYIVPLLIVV